MDIMVDFEDEWGGLDFIGDWWGAYRGKYPEPTLWEYNLIQPFLHKFQLEDDDFVEHDFEHWIFFKNHLGSPPNLRSQLIKFLTQVRATKGYDVDTYFDFSVVSDWKKFHLFVPRNLNDQGYYCQAMAASNFAIRKINNARTGKKYVVLSVEKLVSTTTKLLLLTFTANKIATAKVEIFQAMIYAPTLDPTTFVLQEWKFKPQLN